MLVKEIVSKINSSISLLLAFNITVGFYVFGVSIILLSAFAPHLVDSDFILKIGWLYLAVYALISFFQCISIFIRRNK